MPTSYRRLRLILGDQLNCHHSWYRGQPDAQTLYVLMECRSETDYVKHHIQKVAGFFLAMRHFAGFLREKGHEVLYLELDDARNRSSVAANIKALIGDYGIATFEYQQPDEYRLDEALAGLCEELSIDTRCVDTEHFLSNRHAVEELFAGKKMYLLETFYRHMRRKYDILMEPDGETPLTGQWNYDRENRKKLPKDQALPEHKVFTRDVRKIVERLKRAGVETIGRVDARHFIWPATRAEAVELLEHFARHALPNFGRYQDAMTERDPFLFHSRLSFALNTKMLSPLEVVERCVAEWEGRRDEIDMAQIEGFVRQIIGWREFMRGIYWAKMPEYAERNFFDHQAALPAWYWTGDTEMNCLRHAINQSLDYAYAHHIQRLMVTGNFALLLGVHPDEVDAWYLGIYIDAIQWVEITNTRGMSQFADGGVVGTKPYVSSANYIHKMGPYCKNCAYSHTVKTGEGACPFNSLYWDFYERHRDKLENNPRIGMMYRTWDRMDDDKKEALLKQAAYYKQHVNEL